MKPPEPKGVVSFDESGFIDENGIPVLVKSIELRLERGRVVKETTYTDGETVVEVDPYEPPGFVDKLRLWALGSPPGQWYSGKVARR